MGLLSLIIGFPLLGALVVLLIPSRFWRAYRIIAIATTSIQLVLSLALLAGYQTGQAAPAGVDDVQAFQAVEKAEWFTLSLGSLGRLSVDYFVGADGLNLPLVVLSALILLIGAVSSWKIDKLRKGYFALYLLLSSTIMGCFLALDFFLFYLFFEFMLLPMYFLIGLWGGPRREYASIKFFLYTLAGSLFILVVMVGLYLSAIDPVKTAQLAGLGEGVATVQEHISLGQDEGGLPAETLVHTFNMVQMTDADNFLPGKVLSPGTDKELWGVSLRLLAFLALFIGFAVKLPAVPVHTWLPDAHVEAPTPVSVLLAGLLLKIGGYGFIRTAWLIFPEGAIHYAWYIGLLGVITILYGALNALAQKDIKKLVAYSSVSHMGFVLLGLASMTTEGITGALYMMVSHGLISPLLFLVAGVIYDRTHDRIIDHYSGLASRMPYFTAFAVVACFASLGLPGFSGFVSELLVFLGSFRATTGSDALLSAWIPLLGTLGLVLSAAYYLWTLQRMFFGPFHLYDKQWKIPDLTAREWLMMTPLAVGALLLGIFPDLLIDYMDHSIVRFQEVVMENGLENLSILNGER
ncbi:NuoM family protein [Roseivirga sp. BDSF3-8]|uniref:complex I subunit 4 family protein n=1 Tax=Roseivirga sp. BDSF3-8 TaxID=3241598 RepID=UPI0035322B3A